MTVEIGFLVRLLDQLGFAAVVLGRNGQVIEWNKLARQLIYSGANAPPQAEPDPFTGRTIQGALTDAFGLVELEGAFRNRRLAFQALDIPTVSEAHRLMILIDLSVRVRSSASTLEKIFCLTAAEGRLAAELSNGVSLSTIARRRSVSIATLRTQLASIFAKTDTSRQPELVALLSRVCYIAPMSNAAN